MENKKTLIEWTEECLFSSEVEPFIKKCEQNYHHSNEMMSYEDFMKLKNEIDN